ncbi:hypothetical protein [Streptomyces naganishii]|uniref:Uncharacterized protein n=1 Tax=Streptomyces naganishii JCM 4654 TaxID=1306179 RepID=A0A918Y6L6_9ACTN|nr:hypothetical protein [Streptomyces naganishii]GHD91637.1 hypothetical protein GCM10010508_41310 [Streptomyces naganishii JCM 4654]
MSEDTRSEVYAELAAVGPYGVHPGHALITMVEPHPGHEYAYNRWYEDDHYYAGAMAMPWVYAGRRWVATRDLQLLRYPEKSAVAQPVTAGCYLSTYWITEGRYDDHMRWTVAINKRLNRDSRVHQARTHVFTAFQDHVTTVYRDGAAGPRDYHALDHPYAGLVLEVIDAESPEARDELVRWLRARHLPGRLAGSPAAMVTVFRPTPLPGDRMTYVKQVEGVGTRLTLLWFLQSDPRPCWREWFSGLDEAVTVAGLGRVELVAPFVPTVPGTDTYVDRLRTVHRGEREVGHAEAQAEPSRQGRRAGREGS